MINESELNISNLSYTNKDFETAYAEILGIATEISKRWNPQTSNESDPGVVLLKLLAFFADKLNYNLDKNTLENFLLSCTQDSSMRDLCEMNGYSPRYYQSATTTLSFMYTGYKASDSDEDALQAGDSFTLPAYSTIVEDNESNVSYVLLEPAVISEKNREVTALAMQGSWKYLKVEDSEVIKLANLDDNNRIYFPVANVAENSVIIFNNNDIPTAWKQVKNLNTVIPGTRAFRFGFDSLENLPYLEFTDDISQLIGSGIRIGYMITSGVTGNVKANILNQLKSTSEVTTDIYGVNIPLTSEDSECLSITNKSASVNGCDPETINEAYNSFKKTVGTFDTLVSCRDYANAIYNLIDEASLPLVSNCQVSDRRTDINYGNKVLTHDKYGRYTKNLSTDISSFDICLYPLTPIKYAYSPATYNASFKPLMGEGKYFDIESKIEENKTLAHVYREMSEINLAKEENQGIIYLYKVYYKLNAKITTKEKVNGFEQISILANIYDALYHKFNAREIDYGYEIPYESLLSTIEQADKRIKYVVLDEPELKTKVLLNNNGWEEQDLISTENNNYAKMLAKNIVAGTVPMFEYDNDFNYSYGETGIQVSGSGPVFSNIEYIKTEYRLPVVDASIESGDNRGRVNGSGISRNETLQVVTPSYGTSLSYVAGVAYNWQSSTTVSKSAARHKIAPGEVLRIYYEVDDNSYFFKYESNKVTKRINGGDPIIVSENVPTYIKVVGFDLSDTDSKTSGITYLIDDSTVEIVTYHGEEPIEGKHKYAVLSSDQSIDIQEPIKTIHAEKALPCYWLLNNSTNTLFDQSTLVSSSPSEYVYERILMENEYFMWSDESLADLEILGSGTKLRYTSSTPVVESDWRIAVDEGPTAEEISEAGLAAFSGYPWKYINFSTNNLELMQMDIITLTEGDSFQDFYLEDMSQLDDDYISNNFVSLATGINPDTNLNYSFRYNLLEDGKEKTYSIDLSEGDWKVKTRLDLNAGPEIRQELLTHNYVTLHLTDGTDKQLPSNAFIKFNTNIQTVGSNNIDMRNTDTSSDNLYPVKVYLHNYTMPSYSALSDGQAYERSLQEDQNNELVIPYNTLDMSSSIDLAFVTLPDTKSLISIYSTNDNVEITVSGTNIKFYYSDDTASSLTLVKGVNVIEATGSISISVSCEPGTDLTGSLVIGGVKEVKDLNSRFFENDIFDTTDWDSSAISSLKDAIKEEVIALSTITDGSDSYNVFTYTETLDESNIIEVDDLANPLALFDVNNVCNKFTIAEIGLSSNTDLQPDRFYSSIEISRASKR